MLRHECTAALFLYRQIATKLKRQAGWRAKWGLAGRRYRHRRARGDLALSKVNGGRTKPLRAAPVTVKAEEFAENAGGRYACVAASGNTRFSGATFGSHRG